MTDRRRNMLILLVVAALVAASAAAIASKKTRLGLELKGGVELVYQAKPTAQSKVTPESIERAINIMRSRVDKLGVTQPEIQRSGAEEIIVALPEVHDVKQAEEEVGKTAQLYFYDWETNVIGPTGQPAPSEGTVTGDATSAGPGGVTAGHDPRARLHAEAGRSLHIRQLVPAGHRARKGRAGSRGNRTSRVLLPPQAVARREAQGGARQPRDRAGAGPPRGKRRGQDQRPLAQQLVRAQRRTGADGR
jgi:hypothetical protein